jgi:hypothetical protein
LEMPNDQDRFAFVEKLLQSLTAETVSARRMAG